VDTSCSVRGRKFDLAIARQNKTVAWNTASVVRKLGGFRHLHPHLKQYGDWDLLEPSFFVSATKNTSKSLVLVKLRLSGGGSGLGFVARKFCLIEPSCNSSYFLSSRKNFSHLVIIVLFA
jgi:hypothetical protein